MCGGECAALPAQGALAGRLEPALLPEAEPGCTARSPGGGSNAAGTERLCPRSCGIGDGRGGKLSEALREWGLGAGRLGAAGYRSGRGRGEAGRGGAVLPSGWLRPLVGAPPARRGPSTPGLGAVRALGASPGALSPGGAAPCRALLRGEERVREGPCAGVAPSAGVSPRAPSGSGAGLCCAERSLHRQLMPWHLASHSANYRAHPGNMCISMSVCVCIYIYMHTHICAWHDFFFLYAVQEILFTCSNVFVQW